MICSESGEATVEEFESLCRRTAEIMNEKALNEPDYYLDKGAKKLEPEVKKNMEEAAKGTKFEDKIELISGQKFPDIVAGKYFGLEVKSTKDGSWTVIGGSVAEGTRVDNVNNIFLMFGKLAKPVEFKTRRYQDCLYDIAVTHSPRYKIDMLLPPDHTIFESMNIAYDDLRTRSNPIEPIVKYYRSKLGEGESLWWINGDAADESVPVKIRLFNILDKSEKEDIVTKAIVLFPEIFGNSNKTKYNRLALWLVAKHGITSPALRDSFSAGGQVKIVVKDIEEKYWPQVYGHIANNVEKIKSEILAADYNVLKEHWGTELSEEEDRVNAWIKLVSVNARKAGVIGAEELLNKIFALSLKIRVDKKIAKKKSNKRKKIKKHNH